MKTSLSQALKPLDRRKAQEATLPPASEGAAPARAKAPVPATRAGKRKITFYVSTECRKQFKGLAVAQERTQEAVLAEALNDLFTKYGKAELA